MGGNTRQATSQSFIWSLGDAVKRLSEQHALASQSAEQLYGSYKPATELCKGLLRHVLTMLSEFIGRKEVLEARVAKFVGVSRT